MVKAVNPQTTGDTARPVPVYTKSQVWTHLGFNAIPGKTKLDMTTINRSAHLVRHEPEIKME